MHFPVQNYNVNIFCNPSSNHRDEKDMKRTKKPKLSINLNENILEDHEFLLLKYFLVGSSLNFSFSMEVTNSLLNKKLQNKILIEEK